VLPFFGQVLGWYWFDTDESQMEWIAGMATEYHD